MRFFCQPPLAYSSLFLGLVLAGLVLAGCASSGGYALDRDPPPLRIGYQFVYQHEGPYPWGDGQEIVSGTRTVTVTGAREENGKRLWRVEDFFENVEGSLIGYYDNNYLQHWQMVQLGEIEVRVRNRPPRPVRYLNLGVGQSQTYTIKQSMRRSDAKADIGQSVMTINAERRKDQRIVTDAGAFLCRHFVNAITIESTLMGRTSRRSATEEAFWSDQIGWFVQRKFMFEPVTRDGELIQPRYTSQSTLVSFNAPFEPYSPPSQGS